MKKTLICITLVLFFAASTQAFTSQLETVQEQANNTNPAQFQLEIQNPSYQVQNYALSILSPKSSWFYYPKNIQVPARSNKTAEITVTPTEKAVQQQYQFTGKIRSQTTGELQDFAGLFQTTQPYKLHIISTTQNQTTIKPGQKFQTNIEIQNLDNTQIEDYQLKAQYQDQIKTETGTPILPSGTRKYQFIFDTSKNMSPQTQRINYTLIADQKIQTNTQQTIQIQATRNITRTENSQNKIFTISKTLKAENNGNAPTETVINTSIPSYLHSITTTTPEPSSIQEIDGKTIYSWEKTLQPGKNSQAEIQTQYWIPITGMTLLTLGILAIKLLGQSIQLTKTAETKEETIKIKLEIENTGETTFKKLQLEEFIPDIATVDQTFDMNAPKIRKTSQGTKITWDIENLEPGDQRIITYQIKPKIQVEDEVELQKAEIKNMEGKKIAESNVATSQFQP